MGMMKLTLVVAMVTGLAAAPTRGAAQSTPVQSGDTTAADPLAPAREQVAARNLDSAAALIRRVAEAPSQSVATRVEAWVLLGVVDFYRSGDSATAFAFRQALALDPAFEATLNNVDPAVERILAAERAALPGVVPPPRIDPAAEPVHDCLGKCPEGVTPPQFAFFPQIEFANASVGLSDRRSRTFLTLHAVVGADGIIEPETIMVASGTARGTETEVRRGLIQARFTPGRKDGVRCRTRVTLRFDFEAEGTSWVKYTYRVQSR
jgi:hypothetical protein